MAVSYSRDPQVEDSLRHSLKDARAFSLMVGAGETYFSAFAVLLKASTAQIGLLASLPPLIGSFAQLFSAWLGRRLHSRRRIILLGAYLQVLTWLPLTLLPLLFPERGAQMTHVIQALLLLISGVYFPVSVLPEWMGSLAYLSPATYVLEGMRAALLDGAATGALVGHLGRLVFIGIVAIPVGLVIFRQAEKYAKRTGKLKRSG